MKRLEQVLVATDLSGPARRALERAGTLSASLDVRCAAVHVVHQGALERLRHLLGEDPDCLAEVLIEDARRRLEEQLAATLPESVQAEPRVLVGSVVDTLVAEAARVEAGLVILGARGEGFLRHLLLGTTAERLLRRSVRPVLLVRQAPRDGYRRVLTAVDFSPSSSAALRLGAQVAPAAQRVLLHACEVPFEGKLVNADVSEASILRLRRQAAQEGHEQLQAFAAAERVAGNDLRLVVRCGDPSRVILETAEREGCDLVVIGKRGRGLVEELLLGSVTRHVLADASMDALVAAPD